MLDLMSDPFVQEFVFGIAAGLTVHSVLWFLLPKVTSQGKERIAGISTASGLATGLFVIVMIAGGLRSYRDILIFLIMIVGGYFAGKRQYASAVAARNSKRMKKLREEKRKKKEEEKRLAEENVKE